MIYFVVVVVFTSAPEEDWWTPLSFVAFSFELRKSREQRRCCRPIFNLVLYRWMILQQQQQRRQGRNMIAATGGDDEKAMIARRTKDTFLRVSSVWDPQQSSSACVSRSQIRIGRFLCHTKKRKRLTPHKTIVNRCTHNIRFIMVVEQKMTANEQS